MNFDKFGMRRAKPSTRYRTSPQQGRELNPEEILLDAAAQTAQRIEKPIERRNIIVFALCIGGIMFFMFARVFTLAVLRNETYLARSKANYTRQTTEAPYRGVVYDRSGRALVENIPMFDIVFRTDEKSSAEHLADELKKFSEFFPSVAAPRDPASRLIAEGLPPREALRFAARQELFPGFTLDIKPNRFYGNAIASSHVLGYLGRVSANDIDDAYGPADLIGKTGIEATYETALRGTPGIRREEVNARGETLRVLSLREPVPGHNLVLALDQELQDELFTRLTVAAQRSRSTGGAAVAVDPRNGDVLALVSVPAYDANLFSQGISREAFASLVKDTQKPLFNRAIAARYPVGSTLKPFIAAAALSEKIVTPRTVIHDAGAITVPDIFHPGITYTFRGYAPLGPVNVESAIALSSDIYFYTVGGGFEDIRGLGPERMAEYLSRFGFGALTGIQIPGEDAGFIPTPTWKETAKSERWYIGDSYNISIGQGDIGVTPLQLALATAAVANHGTLWKPRLALRAIDNDFTMLQEFPPEKIRENFITPDVIDIVRSGMRQAVTWGTAKELSLLPVTAAAKTGTAQTGKYSPPHSLVTVFAPYQDPEIVLAIIVEKAGESTKVAVPLAREVLSWYFSRTR